MGRFAKIMGFLGATLVAATMMEPGAAYAGAVGGSNRHDDVAEPKTEDVYRVSFRGGEGAIVTLTADDTGDLDCKVFNDIGTLVADDLSNDDNCFMVWTPRWTGTHTIRVINRSHRYRSYRLTTN